MKQGKIEGIVLKSTPLFDHDKRIELLSKSEGKKIVLAKYANTKSFRFGSKLELGTHILCHTYKGKSFTILTDCDLIQNFPNIRNSYNRIALSLYIIELTQKIASENHHNEQLFTLLKTSLEQLNNAQNDGIHIKNKFQKQLLESEGIIDESVDELSDAEFRRYFQEYCETKMPILLHL